MKSYSHLIAVVPIALQIISAAHADDAVPASISVAPADIHLSAVRDRQALIVQASPIM